MITKPLVSVIIPTYKRPNTLPWAIDSVLAQTYENVEILVVDDNDAGTDARSETEKVMKIYKGNKKVRYIQHEFNKNGAAARNTGFKHSQGEYIMFLDDDDAFLPKKISAQVNRLTELDNSWGACYTRYIRQRLDRIVMTSAEVREGNLLKEALMRNLFIHAGSNLMIRRSVVEELDGFDETFTRNQDLEFLVRLLKNYKLAFTDVLGLIVFVHPRNPSTNFELLTKQYQEKFNPYITQLNDNEQREVQTMLDLQLFRYKITHLSTLYDGIDMILSEKIQLFDAIRYLIHLLYRGITKKSCGFNL